LPPISAFFRPNPPPAILNELPTVPDLSTQASLKPATITQNQLDCLSKIARGLDIAKDNFEAQRRIIEELNLRVTLWVEDGEKKADISLLGNYQNSSLLPAVTVL
jgi:hypothetical protein